MKKLMNRDDESHLSEGKSVRVANVPHWFYYGPQNYHKYCIFWQQHKLQGDGQQKIQQGGIAEEKFC
jgi:hypothetical protein